SNANSVEEAIEKISIFKTLEGIPISILDNLKQQVMENQHLIESKEFLRDFNSMLYKFNVQKLVVGKVKTETEWDDIPF
ncbi:hypothetical protein OVW19_28975, partial [Klebsiella pneumoniae]